MTISDKEFEEKLTQILPKKLKELNMYSPEKHVSEKIVKSKFVECVSTILNRTIKEYTIINDHNPEISWTDEKEVSIIIYFPPIQIDGSDWEKIYMAQELLEESFQEYDINFIHSADSNIEWENKEK